MEGVHTSWTAACPNVTVNICQGCLSCRGTLGHVDPIPFISVIGNLRADRGLCDPCGRDESRDRSIAKHVMSVHINASGVNAGAQEGDIDIATMKKFVSYCRLKCSPRLSEASATMLSSQVQRGNDNDLIYMAVLVCLFFTLCCNNSTQSCCLTCVCAMSIM